VVTRSYLVNKADASAHCLNLFPKPVQRPGQVSDSNPQRIKHLGVVQASQQPHVGQTLKTINIAHQRPNHLAINGLLTLRFLDPLPPIGPPVIAR
jgi:hypothetical protein